MVSWSEILVKKTSYVVGNKKFSAKACILNYRNKIKKVSLQEQSLGTKGERRLQRKRARLKLKVTIDKTIGRSFGNESLEKNLCILGVP